MTRSPIDLQTAADRLGVHYQTAYQWVRSGRLPAQRIRGRYQLDPNDVERLARQRARPAPRRTLRPRAGFAKLAERAYDALVDGDERSLRDLVDRLTSDGTPMTTVTQEILVPAMRRIGSDWSDGVVTITDEHRASAIVERVLGDHYPNPRGGAGAPSSSRHSPANATHCPRPWLPSHCEKTTGTCNTSAQISPQMNSSTSVASDPSTSSC